MLNIESVMSLVPKIDCFESNVPMYRQFLFITNLLFVYSLLQSLSFSIQTNFYLNIFKVIEDRAKWTCRCMPLTLNCLRKWKLKLLVAQSYLTLCSAVSCSLPGSSVRGISQARILEWIAVSFSRGLPDPGIEPRSPALQAGSLPSEPLLLLLSHVSRVRLCATP